MKSRYATDVFSLVIDASNIRGLGTVSVCSSLIREIIAMVSQSSTFRLRIYATPELLACIDLPKSANIEICNTQHWTRIYRFFRYLLPRTEFDRNTRLLVLGDIPLRARVHQVVLVQQAHILAPKVEPFASKSLKFRLMRFLFRRNIKSVKKFFVQTTSMKDGLLNSYSRLPDIDVVSHLPAYPQVIDNKSSLPKNEEFTFFYPASFYPHKNHATLFRALSELPRSLLLYKFILTIDKSVVPIDLRDDPRIECVGLLSAPECAAYFQSAKALFFPSLLESYGLPMIEALYLYGIPVLSADRPVHRELCGDSAIYFAPLDSKALAKAIELIIDNPPVVKQTRSLSNWKTFAKKILESF